jgi:hypothetical protein
MGKFLTDLEVRQIEDTSEQGRGTWRLLAPLRYQADNGFVYEVPVGFVTDFATVPRIPLIFDLDGDRGNLAGTLHDWLYTAPHPVASRAIADSMLREALLAQGCPSWVAWTFYIGVRIGGASHWQTNQPLPQGVKNG